MPLKRGEISRLRGKRVSFFAFLVHTSIAGVVNARVDAMNVLER